MAYTPNRGDLLWMNFDPSAGSEFAKHHPGIVLSPLPFHEYFKLALIAPITSKQPKHAFFVEVNGKHIKGFILCHQVRTMDYKSRNAKYAEDCPQNILEDAINKFRTITGP